MPSSRPNTIPTVIHIVKQLRPSSILDVGVGFGKWGHLFREYTDIVAARRPEWLVLRRGVLLGGRAFAGVGAPFRNADERNALLQRYGVATVIDTTSGDQALVVLRRRE